MIDVDSTDNDIENCLRKTLHLPLAPTDIPGDLEPHSHPCFHFLCRADPQYAVVIRFVKQFGQRLHEFGVRAGSMLVFSSDQCPSRCVFFLGVVLRRPFLHMLVKAAVSDGDVNEVSVALDGGSPCIETSHEMFLRFIHEKVGNSPLKINVEVWSCRAVLQEGHCLRASAEMLAKSFQVTENGSIVKQKPVVKLPFGLEVKKAKRKKRAQAKKKSVTAKAKAEKGEAAKGRTAAAAAAAASLLPDGGGDDRNGGVSSGSGSSNESQDPDTVIDPEKETEEVEPVSEVAKAQQQELPRLAREVEVMDELKEKAAQVIRSGQAGPSRSSYFSKTIGMSGSDLALSNRSTCLHCKTPIKKDTVRFSWYYSTVRPHGYLHSFCVYEYAKRAGMVESTVQKLSDH